MRSLHSVHKSTQNGDIEFPSSASSTFGTSDRIFMELGMRRGGIRKIIESEFDFASYRFKVIYSPAIYEAQIRLYAPPSLRTIYPTAGCNIS
jgi:hypothetical protein